MGPFARKISLRDSVVSSNVAAAMQICLARQRTLQVTAFTVFSAFAFALVLAMAPQWHERVHPNSSPPNHQCAVTLIATGKIEQAPPPILMPAPVLQPAFGAIAPLTSAQLPARFLGAAILEHAPPSFS